jgi:hypothetical protein
MENNELLSPTQISQLKEKNLIVEELKKMPVIQIACKKVGIARATFYRWKKEDKYFAKEVDEAVLSGEEFINDMGESQLISLIKDRNFQAIQLWLKQHHPKYKNKLELSGNINIKEEPLTPEQEATIKEALRLADLPGENGGSLKSNGNNNEPK